MVSIPLERLSSLDRAFLTVESGPLHMHVGAVAIFDGRGLVGPDGALDAASVRSTIAASLSAVPRFKQRVRFFPMLGTVWSPDPHFDLDFHVRHTAVPRPGRLDQLHTLAGRIFSQRLDRERPLWEMWLVEGLEDGRFAIITKAHHALLDGVAGMGLLAALFSLEPAAIVSGDAQRDASPAEPSTRAYAEALFRRRLEELPLVRRRIFELATSGRSQVRTALGGALEMLKSAAGSFGEARPTPLNPLTIGPHRSFDGVALSLEALRRVRRALGCTLNDVVLGVVSAALRRFITARGIDPSEVGEVRALVPVDTRARGAGARPGGNHVAMLIAHLPITEADPRRRIAAIAAHTARLKGQSHEIEAAELIEELGDLGPERLVGVVFDAALHLLPFHVIVTNVPGPQVPLYLGPSKLEALYPLVPLFARQSIGLAVVSYDQRLFVGLCADRQSVPDLGVLVSCLHEAVEETLALAT